MSFSGRQHSMTNGCFQEAKLQGQLYGDESEKLLVESRPKADVAYRGKLTLNL